MNNYFNIFKIWNIRRNLKHRSNLKIVGYFRMIILYPVIIGILGFMIYTTKLQIAKETLQLIPVLLGIFITYLFSLKIQMQRDKKYLKYKEVILCEKGKEASSLYRLFDEYLALVEYSIFLVVCSFFCVFFSTMINSNIMNYICTGLFIYALIFSIESIEKIISRM